MRALALACTALLMLGASLAGCLDRAEPAGSTGAPGVGDVAWADASTPPPVEAAPPEAPPANATEPEAPAETPPPPPEPPREPEPPAPPELVDARLDLAAAAGAHWLNLTLTVRSETPPDAARGNLTGPAGPIHEGDLDVTFTPVGDDLWEARRSHEISRYAPSGTYAYGGLQVATLQGAWTAPFPEPLLASLDNPDAAGAPTLRSLTLRAEATDAGETRISLRLTVASEAPPTALLGQLTGPNGTVLHAGPWSPHAEEVERGHWEVTLQDGIPADAPDGEYTYEDLRIEHAGGLRSPAWPTSPRATHDGAG